MRTERNKGKLLYSYVYFFFWLKMNDFSSLGLISLNETSWSTFFFFGIFIRAKGILNHAELPQPF